MSIRINKIATNGGEPTNIDFWPLKCQIKPKPLLLFFFYVLSLNLYDQCSLSYENLSLYVFTVKVFKKCLKMKLKGSNMVRLRSL